MVMGSRGRGVSAARLRPAARRQPREARSQPPLSRLTKRQRQQSADQRFQAAVAALRAAACSPRRRARRGGSAAPPARSPTLSRAGRCWCWRSRRWASAAASTWSSYARGTTAPARCARPASQVLRPARVPSARAVKSKSLVAQVWATAVPGKAGSRSSLAAQAPSPSSQPRRATRLPERSSDPARQALLSPAHALLLLLPRPALATGRHSPATRAGSHESPRRSG